ncbi:MAG: PQQ-binding-like beta-propeller repeat protein, partial [Acidobacteriia bacterium]|nr:PQQ-binding-like beta-propeller repeat protein [Terriglobia bacterium]MBV8902423.1 PQQ-binding-like beta-propeller repeat protein [Terriglobia bacterium]
TRSYDNARTGANLQETILTPAAIQTRGIKLLFTLNLPGDARGCEAQPLIVPHVKLADGTIHDVVYVATMANQVFAFDANTGAQLWMVPLGTPIKSTTDIDSHMINDHWGVVSTPVADSGAGILYTCAWISKDGTAANGQHFLYALRLRDGQSVHPAINLEGVTYNPGHGRPVQKFRSLERKQRAGLLLVNGTVFIGFGTVAESASTARGWLIAVDTASFKISAAWTSTSHGSGGGIWHSGGGPAADAQGNIYVITGNGDFDALTDFSQSIVKLHYASPGSGGHGSITVTDWWTPWTDDGRTGSNPEGEDEAPRPTNFQRVRHLAARGMLPMGGMDSAWGDQDFGSGGPVLALAAGALLAAGKDGILYTANLNNLGKTQPANLDPAATAQNYAKLKAAPTFYTYYPGPQLNPAPTKIESLNVLPGNVTHHLHGTPVLWNSAAHGLQHFCWGENGNLRAWSLSNSGQSAYLACSAETASAQSPVPPGGMPGGMISLSANGSSGGVVWASIPYGDANMEITAGRFLAYDAANFGKFSDGSGSIVPLWDSQTWNWQFKHNKFNRPVVWNGKVFLPTYDGRVLVIGLA